MTIKAVIFDCFGVLTSDGFFSFCDRHFADRPDLYEQARALNTKVDSGLMAWRDMVKSVAELAELDLEQAFKELSSTVINPVPFELINNQLKSQYKIGLLSNVGYDWPRENLSAEQYQVFDEVLLSYQLGRTKPDALMYETMATRLDMLPEECLLIDDRLDFCEGAKRVGMPAIQFINNQQMLDDVRQALANA